MVRVNNVYDQCPTCPGTKHYQSRQCFVCYNKTKNRLPDYGKGGRPGIVKPPCPKCGGPKRTLAARQCIECHNKEHRGGLSAVLRRQEAFLIETSEGPIRAVDVRKALDPALRPPHYPPACGGCGGFAYIRTLEGWISCDRCYAHPGHACSWEEHRARVA